MLKMYYGFLSVVFFCIAVSCSNAGSREPAADQSSFNNYWFAGKAEITRYALEQARYGEIRQGDAVLVFVTEDFLPDAQVKHEFGDAPDAIPVLKLNLTRKFHTGIYPYSVMTSIFSPVSQEPSVLKVTSTSQEWCGHTFMQLNNRKGRFEAQVRSYFQAEGDQDFTLQNALLEDEIWTRIRLAPDKLPEGKIQIIPGTQYARFRHVPLKVTSAQASLTSLHDDKLSEEELQKYAVKYNDLQRTLAITFEKAFPYRILAWEEFNPSGFGPEAKVLTTKAVRTHSLMIDYWTKNRNSDSHLRKELGLPQ